MKMKKVTKAKLKKLEKKRINKLFKEWTLKVKARDNNQCIICKNKKMLNAHHIITRSNEKLRFDIDNGASLCPLHHNFSREISAHKNSFAFFIWMQENRKEQYESLKKKWKELQ